jgi:hypothetical protein
MSRTSITVSARAPAKKTKMLYQLGFVSVRTIKGRSSSSDPHGMAPPSMLGLCALLLSLIPSPTTCTACAAGTYLQAGASTCTACAAGKYNNGSLAPVVAPGLIGCLSSAKLRSTDSVNPRAVLSRVRPRYRHLL